jgi:isopenicillin N synthase-like dioxygenase
MPEIQTPSHTDFGSITLLMNWLGGLQVWSESARKAGPLEPDSEGEWLWVKPKKGCAIINLGDAMVRFTNGALCSGRYVNETLILRSGFGLRTAFLSGRAGSAGFGARL